MSVNCPFVGRDGRLMGILEVSRSLGDGRFKHCGVVCLPDVKKCQLTDDDRYILLSCDGLWTDWEPSTALEFVQNILTVSYKYAKNSHICMFFFVKGDKNHRQRVHH